MTNELTVGNITDYTTWPGGTYDWWSPNSTYWKPIEYCFIRSCSPERRTPMYCEICGETLEVDDSNTEIRYDKYTGVPYRKGYFWYKCPKWTTKKKDHTKERVEATESDYGYEPWTITYTSDNTSEG